MVEAHMSHGSHMESIVEVPQIRKIAIPDVLAALRAGYGDFSQRPSHVVFLALLYPILCVILILAATGRDLLPMIYPLVAGFSLIGPLAALGLYEMSRRAEQGERIHWRFAFGVFRSAALRPILMLGCLLLFLFSLWILTAFLLYNLTLGSVAPGEVPFEGLFSTPEGWTLILAGNGIGFIFALIVFALSVVAFPLMLDRHVTVSTAMAASLRAVLTNPVPMAVWGGIIIMGLIIGFLPLAVGLAIVFPILGHSTWHIYRALVV